MQFFVFGKAEIEHKWDTYLLAQNQVTLDFGICCKNISEILQTIRLDYLRP